MRLYNGMTGQDMRNAKHMRAICEGEPVKKFLVMDACSGKKWRIVTGTSLESVKRRFGWKFLCQEVPHWAEMRKSGMTYQAIADASGVSKPTVMEAVGRNLPTAGDNKINSDGASSPAGSPFSPGPVVEPARATIRHAAMSKKVTHAKG